MEASALTAVTKHSMLRTRRRVICLESVFQFCAHRLLLQAEIWRPNSLPLHCACKFSVRRKLWNDTAPCCQQHTFSFCSVIGLHTAKPSYLYAAIIGSNLALGKRLNLATASVYICWRSHAMPLAMTYNGVLMRCCRQSMRKANTFVILLVSADELLPAT